MPTNFTHHLPPNIHIIIFLFIIYRIKSYFNFSLKSHVVTWVLF